MERDLMFSHMGNGLSVCDRLREKNGDYLKIAHINPEREVTWYVNDISPGVRAKVEHEARFSDPRISYTQEAKVFSSGPEIEIDPKFLGNYA